MEKLTGKQILEKVEEAGINVNNFAYGEFSDIDLFEGFSDELKMHIKLTEGMGWSGREDYEKANLGGKSVYKMKEEEFELAGSPKSVLGEWTEIEQYGGEDQGSTWFSIKHFVDHGVYIKTDGYYASHHGTDFDDGYGEEVKPVQKTVTVFE